MRNLLTLAGVAAIALTLAVGSASAARVIPTPPPPTNNGGGNNGGNVCTVLCIQLPHRISFHDYQICSDKLAQLGRVTPRQIAGVVDGHKVHVVPLCDTTTNHSLTQPEQAFLARGNIQGLLPVIAANPVLVSKLDESGYKTDEVLGVKYASNATLLYVTHR